MNKFRPLKAAPDSTPEKQRTHLEWCDAIRTRQGIARIIETTMICAYLDKDFVWVEQFFAKAGDTIPAGITGEEYWASQEPVFDTLMMGEIPSDEDLEKAKQFRVLGS